jgi:two-component system sensor histidine kinase KdpD
MSSMSLFDIQHARNPHLRGVLSSLALVGLATVALAVVISLTDIRHISIGYVIPVLIAAVRWGIFESIVASAAAIAASAFFFYAPIYDFRVHDPLQIVDLCLFLFVAIVTGHLASRLRAELDRAKEREEEIGALYAFSRRLAPANRAADIYNAIQQHLTSLVGHQVVLFGPLAADGEASEWFGKIDLPDRVRSAVMSAFDRKGGIARDVLVDDGGRNWLVTPVSTRTSDFGIVAVDICDRSQPAAPDMLSRIQTVLLDAAASLERLGLEATISEVRTRSEAERLRDALLGSVSHELRTPLASILGATTALALSPQVQSEDRLAGLAKVAREEAERLNDDIQNLLDATRISSDGVKPTFEWSDPSDIVNAAVERRRMRLGKRRIEMELPDDPPLLYVDSVLIEQSLGQILDNAGKYSADDSTIRIEGRLSNQHVTITVSDQGAGFSDHERLQAGQRFFRGPRQAATTAGAGLGLWIAKAFVAANAGTIEIASRGEGQGASVSIRLPVTTRERNDNMEAENE